MRKFAACLYNAVFCLLLTIFAAGCYFETHRGYYDAAKVPGWKKWNEIGANFFRFPIKHAPNWYIELRGVEKGSLWIHIGSNAFKNTDAIFDVAHFSSEPVRIIFHDRNNEVVVLKDSSRWAYMLNIAVGDSSDFTVVVPSFQIGNETVPELPLRCRWTDNRYVMWIPIQ